MKRSSTNDTTPEQLEQLTKSELSLFTRVCEKDFYPWEKEKTETINGLIGKGYVTTFGKGQEMLILTDVGRDVYKTLLKTYQKSKTKPTDRNLL